MLECSSANASPHQKRMPHDQANSCSAVSGTVPHPGPVSATPYAFLTIGSGWKNLYPGSLPTPVLMWWWIHVCLSCADKAQWPCQWLSSSCRYKKSIFLIPTPNCSLIHCCALSIVLGVLFSARAVVFSRVHVSDCRPWAHVRTRTTCCHPSDVGMHVAPRSRRCAVVQELDRVMATAEALAHVHQPKWERARTCGCTVRAPCMILRAIWAAPVKGCSLKPQGHHCSASARAGAASPVPIRRPSVTEALLVGFKAGRRTGWPGLSHGSRALHGSKAREVPRACAMNAGHKAKQRTTVVAHYHFCVHNDHFLLCTETSRSISEMLRLSRWMVHEA